MFLKKSSGKLNTTFEYTRNNGDSCTIAIYQYDSSNIQYYSFACFLHGCEPYSLTLRKVHRQDMGRMARIIFEPKREKDNRLQSNAQ